MCKYLGCVALAAAVCAAQRGPDTWRTVSGPAGFRVEVPRAWQVRAEASGRVRIVGPSREEVIVWPVFISGTMNGQLARVQLKKLGVEAGISGAWSAPESLGPAAVRAVGRVNDRSAMAAFAWKTSPKGTAGWYYFAAAPSPVSRITQAAFKRILVSFHISGAPPQAASGAGGGGWNLPAGGSPGAATLRYTRWQDPKEGAFSIDVPAGWRMQGGLFRFGALDVRKAWEMTSPGGAVRITGGDAEVPTFTEPNQMLLATGFPEGSWYPAAGGGRMMVRRYMPGTAFAREYAATHAARGSGNLVFTDARDRPDADAALNALMSGLASVGGIMRIHSGEASFTFEREGRPMAGYYFAGILRSQTAGTPVAIWHVEHLYGFVAPREQAAFALAAANHVVASFRVNPQWAAAQSRTTMEVSRIVGQTHAEISKIISDTYWSRQRSLDEMSRRRSNATLGLTDVIDPVSGRQTKVENTSNYYWVDQRGTIAGTDTDTRPSIDFERVTQLP